MATGNVITNNGRKIALNRLFKSTPDYTVPTTFRVGTGTTTPAITDTALSAEVGGIDKAFVAGYPVLDETNLQSTIRGLLLTTEGNSNTLAEWGIFNADGTPKLFSRAVHTAIAKTSSIQIIYVEKDKIT